MYSGITQGLFSVSQINNKEGAIDYAVMLTDALVNKLQIGSSVSIDGVCQSVCKIEGHEVYFTAMVETLNCTTLKNLTLGKLVSVELSLRFGDEVGGHLLAGHVIGTARVHSIDQNPNNLSLTLDCPAAWMKYILPKGFVAVEGSSLTIGETNPAGSFTVHLIPETLRVTNFGKLQVGDWVNIELDHQIVAIVATVERVMNEKK